MGILERALADDFGGYPADNSKGLHVFSNNCSGSDDGTITDRDAGEDDRAGANKDVVADCDRGKGGREVGRRDIMLGAIDHDLGGDVGVTADCDSVTSIDKGGITNNSPLPYPDIARVKDADARMERAVITKTQTKGAPDPVADGV